MDYEEYRKAFFSDPVPRERFATHGVIGATLYYEDYQAALSFITKVFGEPIYKEGANTHGWRLGSSWLTLFPAKSGNPTNVEVPIYLKSAEELDKLYSAFIAAGVTGEEPQNTLMFEPVRVAILADPFGVTWDLVAQL
ncbi:MAG: VOC family protein [Anaerolineales bacterium]